MNNSWTARQYVVFRLIFGTYLLIHFWQLIPWGAEMFSNLGVLPESNESPLTYLFPNILAVLDFPIFVKALLVVGVLLSVLFALGIYDRMAAVILWYIWACLYGRNPLISNPSLPYIGLLLLSHACLPRLSFKLLKKPETTVWKLSPPIYLAVWALMALGYSYSGYTKLISPSWMDGTALIRVLENPLAYNGSLKYFILSMPEICLMFATWGALMFEVSFAPLALFKSIRPFLWAAMLLMHLSLLLLIDFCDLSMGMVMLHLFTFDPGWIKKELPTLD
jgi:hypothetical protein